MKFEYLKMKVLLMAVLFSYLVSSWAIAEQTPQSPTKLICDLDTKFIPTAIWTNLDDTKGFLADVELTNIGKDLVDWELTFDFDADISDMWNASYIKDFDSSKHTITPVPHNIQIKLNQTLTFSIEGLYQTETLNAPSNVECKRPAVEAVLDPAVVAAIDQTMAYIEETQNGSFTFNAYEQEIVVEEGIVDDFEVWIISILGRDQRGFRQLGPVTIVMHKGEETPERFLIYKSPNNGPIVTIAKSTGDVLSLEWWD